MVINMKSAILSIGNEVVEGYVTNINATYFSTKLNEIGIKVNKHLTVLDTSNDIIEAINYLNKDHDLIIVSGGLGPTGDDITKESIAKAVGLELKLNDIEHTKLKEHFARRNRVYSDTNDKQAYYSELDVIIDNPNGTANAYYFTKDKTTYCVLPGPPNENRQLMDEFVETLSKEKVYERNIYLINIGESSSEEKMKHLYDIYPDVYIGCYMQDLGLNYRIKSTNKKQLEQCEQELKTIFKDNYLSDSTNPINDFITYLIDKNITISFAESCTAGLACALIADVPGVSTVLNESLVTYANNAKHKYLNVSSDILNNQGAVSKECAEAMAQGLALKTGSDLNISITGIAGPDGGSETKPVGLVHFAIYYNKKTYHYKEVFSGTRNLIRTRAAKFIIFEAYRLLKCTI